MKKTKQKKNQGKHAKERKLSKKWSNILGFAIPFVAIVGLFFGVGWLTLRPGESSPTDHFQSGVPVATTQPKGFLLMGSTDGKYISAFAYLHVNFQRSHVRLAVFPCETQCRAGGREDSLAGQYAYGGLVQVKEALKETFGLDTDYDILTDLKPLIRLIDDFGGFTDTLEEDEKAVFSDGTEMEWSSGWQTLVGTQTAALLRRPVDGKTVSAHCNRQGEVLTALLNEHFRPENMKLANTAFRRVANEMKSNLTVADFQNLQHDMELLAQSNGGELVEQVTVKGDWQDGLFVPSNMEEIKSMTSVIK